MLLLEMSNQRKETNVKKLIFLQLTLVLVSMQTTPLLATNIKIPSINTMALEDLKLSPIKLAQPPLISSIKTTNSSVNNTVQPIETINVQNEQLKPIKLNASSSIFNTATTKTIQTIGSEDTQVSYGQKYGKLSLQELAHVFLYSVQPLTLKSVSNAIEAEAKAQKNGNIIMNNSEQSAFNKIMTKNALKLTKDLLDSAESQALPTLSSNKYTTNNNGVSQTVQNNLTRAGQSDSTNNFQTSNNESISNTIQDTNKQATHLL